MDSTTLFCYSNKNYSSWIIIKQIYGRSQMKIAFSTLGCPDFSWNEIYAMAKDLGYDGIEVRGLGNELAAFQAQPFHEEH